MDPFEVNRVKTKYATLLKKLEKGSKFTPKELETLLLIHYQGREESGYFDRRRFRSFIHYTLDITDGSMKDSIFRTFDSRSVNWITFRQLVHGFGIFFRGSPEEQTDFCYTVYQKLTSGKLSREKMFQHLRRCIIRAPSEDDAEEGAKDLVEALFKFYDQDKDGRISLADFREAVRKEPLLMEGLGQCIPDWRARNTFLTAIAENPPVS